MVLSVDIEKAFDSVEWPYLFRTLLEFRLGDPFVKWTELFYISATASVRTGAVISTACQVKRGTRQGCLLSPLLFALAMEPLASHARSGARYLGLALRGEGQYISLYADDLVLFLSDMGEALEGARSLLRDFGRLSGLRVNWRKTSLFPITPREYAPVQVEDIRWEPHCLPYLGTNIYHSPANLLEGNVSRAFRALKGSFGFWQTLPLSVADRVALLKMVALPRLLYFFLTLPIWIPGPVFQQLRTMTTGFVWGSGRRRVAMAIMMRPRADGGLAVPNFEWYYLAAQLQWLTQAVAWEFRGPDGPIGRIPRHILSFIVLQQKMGLDQLTVEEGTLRLCWNRSQRRAGFTRPYAPEIPLGMCTALPHDGNWSTLATWEELGVQMMGYLYEDGVLLSFQALQLRYDLPWDDYLLYVALVAGIQRHWGTGLSEPQTSLGCQYVVMAAGTFKAITCLYRRLSTESLQPLLSLKGKWEVDLGKDIPEKTWPQLV